MLCQYSRILGEPGKGIHQYRIFNLAIVDILSTIIVSKIISYYFELSFYNVLIIFFILGIILQPLVLC